MPAKKSVAPKNQKSFEGSLWDTAIKPQGSVESVEYKHVVLSLIFLKFISGLDGGGAEGGITVCLDSKGATAVAGGVRRDWARRVAAPQIKLTDRKVRIRVTN